MDNKNKQVEDITKVLCLNIWLQSFSLKIVSDCKVIILVSRCWVCVYTVFLNFCFWFLFFFFLQVWFSQCPKQMAFAVVLLYAFRGVLCSSNIANLSGLNCSYLNSYIQYCEVAKHNHTPQKWFLCNHSTLFKFCFKMFSNFSLQLQTFSLCIQKLRNK